MPGSEFAALLASARADVAACNLSCKSSTYTKFSKYKIESECCCMSLHIIREAVAQFLFRCHSKNQLLRLYMCRPEASCDLNANILNEWSMGEHSLHLYDLIIMSVSCNNQAQSCTIIADVLNCVAPQDQRVAAYHKLRRKQWVLCFQVSVTVLLLSQIHDNNTYIGNSCTNLLCLQETMSTSIST